MNDPILAKALPLMKQNFPDAPVTETEDGHFLQEEVPAQIAAALLRVMDQIQPSKDGDTNRAPEGPRDGADVSRLRATCQKT